MAQYDDYEDDATLVERVLAGEREVFGSLLLRHAQSVIRLCQRVLMSPVEAQDVAQEAALEAFLRLADLREPARFGAWLHGIAANLARMALRRRSVNSLTQLGDDTAMVMVGAQVVPTPEDAYAIREIHQSIVAAIDELPAATRATVVGFFLDGYTYVELGELLGVPVSTVRGRLYQGRQHLRRALRPLVREGIITTRKPSYVHPKEITMERPELVEMVIGSVQKVPFLKGEKSFEVILRDPVTAVEQRIVMREAEVGAIQHARGEVWHTSPPPLPADLTLRLLALTTAKVEHVIIHHLSEEFDNWLLGGTPKFAGSDHVLLAAESFYTTIIVGNGEQRTELEVRLSEGLALASAGGAPIYVKRTLFESTGIDSQPDVRDEMADLTFRQRLATLVEVAEPRISTPKPALLVTEVQQQVDAYLARLCGDTDAQSAVLIHRSGTLVGAQGPIDRASLEHYSKALTTDTLSTEDGTDLGRYKSLLMDDLFTPDAWLLFWQWSDWFLQISGPPAGGPPPDTTLDRLKVAVKELAELCTAPTSTSEQ